MRADRRTLGIGTPSRTVRFRTCRSYGCNEPAGTPPEALTRLGLVALEAACRGTPRPASYQKRSFSSIYRRATSDPPLSKGAIAGVTIGATLFLFLIPSLVYLYYRRRGRDSSERTSIRIWKGPRRTTSSLDFRCRTRVTPVASRVDFRRLHMAEAGVSGNDKRRSGIQKGDALGSNPVLASTLGGETPARTPRAGSENSWNGRTLGSASQSPRYTGSVKWAPPAVPSPRTPAPTYSPHRISPYTLRSATPSSTKSAAPLLPAKTTCTPPKYGSVSSPSSYRSAGSGYGSLCPPGEIWEGPTRALRTQKGAWDLRSLGEGRRGAATPSAIAEVGGGGNWGRTRTAVPWRGGEHWDV